MVTKGTQTLITSESLSKLLSKPKIISTSSQISPVDHAVPDVQEIDKNSQNVEHLPPSSINCAEKPELVVSELDDEGNFGGDNCEEGSCGDESSEEEFNSISDDDTDSDEDIELNEEVIMLSKERSIQDQLKFIICEESIVRTFSVCLKCGSQCSVSVGKRIGSYCQILISCSLSAGHDISWSTGPLLNRLPAFNLLMACSILSTGMECNKTLRFMESLNILCLKRREFSNIQSAYVLPAVINVWKMQQNKLLSEIQGQQLQIASDMRVDSPGHTGLIGAGSTLDVGRNIILDTQIIKV